LEVSRLMLDMLEYHRGDFHRIGHAQKVLDFVRLIAELEGTGEKARKLLECAAILHDIGIPEALRIHGSSAPPFQEREGERVAGEILAGYDMDEADRRWIREAVGAHHSPEKVEARGIRILFEADWLVNIMEKKLAASPAAAAELRGRYFSSPSGLRVFDILFGPPEP